MVAKDVRGQTRERAEFEALSRQGMRWAVLLSLNLELNNRGVALPFSVTEKLRTSRVMLESGCFRACDIGCSLDEIEAILVPKAASFGEEYFEGWLALLEKAMRRQLIPEEVKGLPFLKPIISDCAFLKCGCYPNKNTP